MKMYTMKETCEATGLSYETLKFYCREGLIPRVVMIKITTASLTKRWLRGLKICNA